MKVQLNADEANKLLRFQRDNGLSNTAMAEHLGVSPGVWTRAMAGESVRIGSYKKLTAIQVDQHWSYDLAELQPNTIDIEMGDAHDMVNSPSHYADSSIECIDAMVAAFGQERVQDYSEIAAFKYQWRCGKKLYNDANQDKAKSVWYLRYSMGDDPRED
jgi:hypothetical protein